MSFTQVPFEVIQDPNGTSVDVTTKISAINSCKFQGTGRIRIASLMLNAEEGAFMTNTNSGATPQVNQFTAFRIRWQDDDLNIRSATFEVDTELGQLNESGTLLPLELKGRERSLQDMKFTAYFEFITPFTALALLTIMYNTNKGSAQPELTIGFPSTNTFLGVTNIYDFSTEISYYDAFMHIIERANQPTSNGGLGNFFSIIIDDNAADIIMTIKEQGSGGSAILNPITAPVHSLTERIDSQIGNQVFVRGQPNTGSVPGEFHDFSSIVEEINNYPGYVDIANYVEGQHVIVDGIIFEANQDVPTSTPPPSAEWTSKTFDDIANPLVSQYSPWTNNKAVVTKNSCSNPTNPFLTSGYDSPAFPDGNLVVRESFYERDFVIGRSITDDLENDTTLKFYLRGQLNTGLYNGFRLLVDTNLGNPNGAFGDGAGIIFNDRFGRSFENALVQYLGLTDEWIVFMSPNEPNEQDKAFSHCCVLAEGKIYEFNKDGPTTGGKQKLAIRKAAIFRGATGPFSWQDASDDSLTNDAFHHPKSITSVDGLITDTIRSNQDVSSYLTNSAIEIIYEYDLGGAFADAVWNFLERVGGFFDSAIDNIERLINEPIEDTVAPTSEELEGMVQTDVYDFGWWYALPFPYPFSEFNSITEEVGDLYGLGSDANGLNTALFGHLDIQNTTFSSQGNFGLNHDQVSDMGSPFTALGFLFSFSMASAVVDPIPFQGDIPFTITIYDDLSQVWRADYNYRHLGDVTDFTIPFSSFTVERPSRVPWAIDTLLINLLHTPELEIRSIFQERRVRLITWQLKTSYDDNERYLMTNTGNFFNSIAFGTLQLFRTTGIIDGLRLIKQPFISSGVETTRVLNSKTFQAAQTRNKRQLEAIAFAEQQRQSLQFESYVYETDIRCDLQTEQTVTVENEDMIKSAELPVSSLDSWVISTPYGVSADVQNGGTGFRCKVAHQSASINEPGIGADFAIFWNTLSDPIENTRDVVVMTEDFMYNADGRRGGAIMEITTSRRLPVGTP